ncbi:MAG: hypothetical protein ACRED1_02560 [Limisphaerales bacterium]
MSDPITGLLIQIKADASQAIAQLQAVAGATKQVTAATAAVSPVATAAASAVTATGKAATEAGQHFAGMSYYFRSGIDQIRFALMGGGARAGF